MYILGTDPSLPPSVTEAIRSAASERGTVGIITIVDRKEVQSPQTLQAEVSHVGWDIRGNGSLEEVLDMMSPRCDFVLLEGGDPEQWPTLTWENDAVTGEFLSEPTKPDAIDPDAVLDRVEDTEPWITLEALIQQVKSANEADQSGAIATFTGRVRAKESPTDTPTEYLEFERYGEIADRKMATIRKELCDREGVFDVRMHHRTGVIPAGVDIVFVVVLAGHRDEAFQTVEDGINRLKAEVPIFKKEVTVDEEFWVHTRP